MKKTKKGKAKPAKAKRRSKPKTQLSERPKKTDSLTAADHYAGGFDFTAPVTTALDDTGTLDKARKALQDGNPQDALKAAQELLTRDPRNIEALNIAGVSAFQSGDDASALDLFRTAVAFEPDDAESLTNLANIHAAQGDANLAATTYAAAILANPQYADAPFNLAILMDAAGRHAEALETFDRALELRPGHAATLAGKGNALKALKRLDDAKVAYEAALARNPSLAEARTNLAAVLQELGDFEGAAREAKRAFEIDPDLLEAEYNHAIALQELGQYEEAIKRYRHVLHHAPEFAPCALNIGYGLQKIGNLDEAAEAFEQAIAIDPDFAKAHVNLADLRLQQGDPDGALKVCDAFLQEHPGQTDLLAFRSMSLWDDGREDEARTLTDFERFVRPEHITPPTGFGDLETFNNALCEHVLAHPTLTLSPQSHATRNGKHSGELLSDPKGPIAGLEAEIFRLAGDYRDNLGSGGHPFVARAPKDWTLSVWGVVMESAGHQIPHIHPAAWLSGVYYPKLPEIVGDDAGGKAGWIEFGRPPEHFHNARAPETLSVRPEPGMMVLFPSYFYHHTVPFEADGMRISIAFDLMPA